MKHCETCTCSGHETTEQPVGKLIIDYAMELQTARKALAETIEYARQSMPSDRYRHARLMCRGVVHTSPEEPEVARPQLEWEVTYDVVAYNESWGGYGDNASKNGFQSAEEAIAYAKPLGVHLDATVWQRTKPKSVTPAPSIKIWSAENGT